MNAEFIIVGSGLTGAVIARELADAGRAVRVLERRAHAGGNVFDHAHESGIRIHTYGPHYFRTNSDEIWTFVNRFARFHPYVPEVRTLVDGRLEQWPVAASTIQRLVGGKWHPAFSGTPSNFEEASLAMMPRVIYEKFVRGYTEKQWGVRATELAPSLARRFDVRDDDDPRFMRHKHQGIPENGYAAFMAAMLRGIPLQLGCDWLRHRSEFPAKMTIFTGPVDAFFDYDHGRLKYRAQRREHDFFPEVKFVQPCGQVNNPGIENGPHIRTLEWKYMIPPEQAHAIRGSVLTREITVTAQDVNDYEYPFPDAANSALYEAYRARAEALPGVLICGRLGEYRYYDMDQAIARARMLAARLLER